MTKKTYKIFIDSGGWYIAYYMGLFHYIFMEFGVECFKHVYFEGVSAGGQTCGYAIATIHGCKDMKYWLNNGPKQSIYDDNYGNGRLTLGCYKAGKSLYKKLNKHQCRKIKKYYSSLCLDSSLKPYYCNNITNAKIFGCAVASTGNIPLIGSLFAWRYKNKLLWDGNLILNYDYCNKKTYNADNVLFISLDSYKFGDDIVYLNLSSWVNKTLKDSIFTSFLSKTDALANTDRLFNNGYNDAKCHHNEIHDKLKAFGIL
jgi:hypothetical protein